jgi:hypothetical protein
MAAGAIIAAAFVLCVGGVVLSASLPERALASPRAAVPAPPTDACALLTQDQVKAALGVPVGAGQRIVSTSPKLCGWNQAGSSGPSAKRVMTALITVDMFSHEKTPLEGIKETQLSGVGDEAHYMTTPGFGTGLSVKKGSFVFKVRVYGFSLDQIEAKEKALALDVIAKL